MAVRSSDITKVIGAIRKNISRQRRPPVVMPLGPRHEAHSIAKRDGNATGLTWRPGPRCHCEERSDEATSQSSSLLCYVRNDRGGQDARELSNGDPIDARRSLVAHHRTQRRLALFGS